MTSQENYEYIYEMSWYESKRHTKPCSIMLYLKEKHTRWGHNWEKGCNGSQRCEIRVIQVLTSSKDYDMAVNNSQHHEKNELVEGIPDYLAYSSGFGCYVYI